MTVADTVINSAMDGSKILAFNYASQALNNHFFLENLVTYSPAILDWQYNYLRFLTRKLLHLSTPFLTLSLDSSQTIKTKSHLT